LLTFHPVNIERELDRSHPLFVGRFYPLKGMWWTKRKQRQGLIISIAVAWYRLMRTAPVAGFAEKEIFITHLTSQVKDARKILDRFFKVNRIGYNFNNGMKCPSLVVPKKQTPEMVSAIEGLLNELHFDPGPAPANDKRLVTSDVIITKNTGNILKELKEKGREDLIPAVAWILKQKSPITFYFKAAGVLKARDTSVWPIRAVETWPGWLRSSLFGTAIDIESAYLQFILGHLREKYKDDPNLFELRYCDLIQIAEDKKTFREELLKALHLANTKSNMKLVKQLIMALANGSNASPALMTSSSMRCEAVRIVRVACPQLLATELAQLGRRLQKIVKQFQMARRDLCIHLLKAKPTRENQKKIFRIYMKWERDSRYKIWEAGGKTGLMLHDGIDGIITNKSDEELSRHIEELTSLKVSAAPSVALESV
jgi:hypothetical protein